MFYFPFKKLAENPSDPPILPLLAEAALHGPWPKTVPRDLLSMPCASERGWESWESWESWDHPLGRVYVPIDEVGTLLSSSPSFPQQDDGRLQMEAMPRDPCDPHGASVSEPSQLLHEAWQVQQQLWQLVQQQFQLQHKQLDLLSQLNQLQAEDEIHGRPEGCGSHGQHQLQVQAQYGLQHGPGCTMHRADQRALKALKASNKKGGIIALPTTFGTRHVTHVPSAEPIFFPVSEISEF
jgi:hypothetical protein